MSRQKRPAAHVDTDLLEQAARAMNHLPDQNPNPVMRLADDGQLLYANAASQPIRQVLGVQVGGHLTTELMGDLRRRAARTEGSDVPDVEVEAGGRTFELLPVPFPDLGLVNLYGTDITARKVVDKFPDRNPSPVMRITEQGRLLYANAASEPIAAAVGARVGEPLPTDLADQILRACRGQGGPVEVRGEHRTWSLWPVRIPEFDFINVYGTDITALKALDKFPDQNPNPVMRISQEGALLYANPASAPVTKAFGVGVSETLPPRWMSKILGCLEPGAERTLEVESEGRIFEILVVRVFEFDFINLYGTDITAAREVERALGENERLLLNILPASIAERLRAGETVIADGIDEVTLLFADIVDFTPLSSGMAPTQAVELLNQVFSLLDGLSDKYGLEKIKTIGDAYMVVGGLPPNADGHCERVADMALELCAALRKMAMPIDPSAAPGSGAASGPSLEVRVGIHTGPVVAGVIGVKKFSYDVWGDTVNVASRMESQGVPGEIQVTEQVQQLLCDRFLFEPRGTIDVRGKGPMATWFLRGRGPGPAGAT